MIDNDVAREIAIKNNIKDDTGKYSFEEVKFIVNLHNEYTYRYMRTKGVFKKLKTLFGTYTLRLRRLRTLIRKKNKDTVNDYIDIYNSVMAYKTNILTSKLKDKEIKFRMDCIEGVDIENSDVLLINKPTPIKKEYSPSPKKVYFNKIVEIISGEHLSKKGLAIEETPTLIYLRLLDTGEKIKELKSNLIICNTTTHEL
jgi:hypothetical protein